MRAGKGQKQLRNGKHGSAMAAATAAAGKRVPELMPVVWSAHWGDREGLFMYLTDITQHWGPLGVFLFHVTWAKSLSSKPTPRQQMRQCPSDALSNYQQTSSFLMQHLRPHSQSWCRTRGTQALPTAPGAISVPIRKAKFTLSPPSTQCDTQHKLLLSSAPFFGV